MIIDIKVIKHWDRYIEGITSSCSTLGGLTYVRGTVMAAVGKAELTLETLMSQLL